MCPRPARRPDTHFLRMGREGAHGLESRAKVVIDAPGVAFSRRGLRRSAVAEACCVRSGVSRSLPLPLSKHLVVISAVSNAELECPSEFRDSQAVARICVHVFHRTDPPSRSFRTERGLRPPTFHLSPRRETAARQPRCFPPLGIDVHGDRSLCVHRQVLRPRERPFDRVPRPLEDGDSLLRFGEAAPFFTAPFCPTSTASSIASRFGGPLAERRPDFSLVNFRVGVVTASCGSVVPDKSSKGACAPPDAGLEPSR